MKMARPVNKWLWTTMYVSYDDRNYLFGKLSMTPIKMMSLPADMYMTQIDHEV